VYVITRKQSVEWSRRARIL